MYLVRRPGVLSPAAAAAVFAFGLAMIAVNYDADRQRAEFRRSGGRTKVWGRVPRKIEATYETADGKKKTSLLLVAGWWGLARHFHYLPEILAAAAWSCGGGLASPLPYVYLIFLVGLLADRAFRDDERCRSKYGDYWEQYCKLVPSRVVPGIF
jgi:7-dehydrocholesterol reductase